MITILMSLELINDGFVSLFLFLCLGCCLLRYGLLSKKKKNLRNDVSFACVVQHNFHLSASMKLSSTAEISMSIRSNMKAILVTRLCRTVVSKYSRHKLVTHRFNVYVIGMRHRIRTCIGPHLTQILP